MEYIINHGIKWMLYLYSRIINKMLILEIQNNLDQYV